MDNPDREKIHRVVDMHHIQSHLLQYQGHRYRRQQQRYPMSHHLHRLDPPVIYDLSPNKNFKKKSQFFNNSKISVRFLFLKGQVQVHSCVKYFELSKIQMEERDKILCKIFGPRRTPGGHRPSNRSD